MVALIDEATCFQYERARDALEVKLPAFLEGEMRVWEKTFPGEWWLEFERLTGWKGEVRWRPKWWGHPVNELVCDYPALVVTRGLGKKAPKPRLGQSHHRWLSSQHGLQKLVEHVWKLIGIARTCENISDLKAKIAMLYGRTPAR